MKVQNPRSDRPLIANVFGAWYEIPAGESIDVEDAAVASTLIEYGATASRVEIDAARAVHAETNRGLNSRTASASSSEGQILGRQQRTVSVESHTATGGEPLKGRALEEAVREANASGAKIDTRGSADEKRTQLAAWQASRGASTPPNLDGEFVVDDAGNLILDSEDQPIPADTEAYERDENGAIVLDDEGHPVAKPQDGDEGDES